MYCRNCGSEIDQNAAICVKCGFAKGTGTTYCANCGQPVAAGAGFCTSCGFAINNAANVDPSTQKSKMTAGLLGIFLGGLGIHNFYLGYTGKAIAQIALSFCFGIGAIWGLIEGIMILTGSINTDANGVPLKD
ncbi:MAG: TM2 domain-containing protein [Clostridia bacterium]|nr:TM2 domain-containing protein [Clostridia bacterium]